MGTSKRDFEEAQNAAKDVFASFRKRTEADQLRAAEKKANHVMRDLNYWITRYIDQNKPMPRQFSGYIEEHSAYNQALDIEKHNALVEKARPWIWLSVLGVVIFVVLSIFIGFIYVLVTTLFFAIILLFVFGFSGVTHL